MIATTSIKGKFEDLLINKVLHANTSEQQSRTEALQQHAKNTHIDPFLEDDPTVKEWLSGLVPTRTDVAQYTRNLFPSSSWVRRYNLHWLIGDAIAGLTVGLVVVPQAMAYALLARLTPAYGLYTTFTGAALYWIFGTSKDIVIGTTAVGSLLVGSVVSKVEAEKPGVYSAEEIAHALSFLAGLIILFFGFCRLGWIIEFIPYIPINAFVTSASITIMSTQIPLVMGIQGINTRESPYRVLINTMKGLPRSSLDAAIGLTSIALLFIIRDVCAKMEVRQPSKKRLWSLLSALRLTFTILLYTFISWLVHRKVPEGESKFKIVGTIEPGFKHAGVPRLDTELLGLVAPELPAIVIILIVEHIAIAKSFGRTFGYTVIASQEMIAQGFANIFSPFVGGYVCTGSFGASAVLSKAGVRTPLAGLFSALVLVLALYALTAVFYYIPNAALAGLIIHATCNLITPPRSLYRYWTLAPFEMLIWVIGVVLAMFTDLETSIYATIALSFALLLIRSARTPGHFRGRVQVSRVDRENATKGPFATPAGSSSASVDFGLKESSRDAYLPLNGKYSRNPNIKVEPPYPGVFIYKFAENFNYINQAHHVEVITSYIYAQTRRTMLNDGISPKDRLWSDAPPPSDKEAHEHDDLPILRAIILDFSAVNVLDITSVQGLIDLRNTLDRYAAPATVEWHFAGVHNRWTRRALAISGFGYPTGATADSIGNWRPAYTVATSMAGATQDDKNKRELRERVVKEQDEERKGHNGAWRLQGEGRKISTDGRRPEITVTEKAKAYQPIYGVDRPFFHVDLVDAVDMAVRDATRKDEEERAQEARERHSEEHEVVGAAAVAVERPQ